MLTKTHVVRNACAVAALVFVFGSSPALAGEFRVVPLNANLHFGESRTLVTNGSLSVVAECAQAVPQPVFAVDRVRLLAATTVDGAFMDGADDHTGVTTLNTTTPADDRELNVNTRLAGLPSVENDDADGFVQSADGHFYIGVPGETTALGLNTHAGDCSVRGVAFVINNY